MEIDFGDLIDAVPGLIWTTSASGGCDFVNRAWREYTGVGGDQALGDGWQATIHPDDRTSALRAFNERTPGEIDARLRRFDGEYRWFVFRHSAVPAEMKADERWCWLGSEADEKAATDGRVRRLFDMLPIQAGFLNAAGVLEFSNLQSLKDFNMTKEELEAWTTSGIIHVEDHEKTFHAVTALLSAGERYDMEIRMLHPNGSYRWTRAQCLPWRDAQGNVVRYVSFQIDTDDLRQAEALLAAEVRLLEMVARGEPLRAVLDSLCRSVETLCGDCACSVLLVTRNSTQFEVGAAPSLPAACADVLEGALVDADDSPAGRAVLELAPVVTLHFPGDPDWREAAWSGVLERHGYSSYSAIPILASSRRASGVVALFRSTELPLTPAHADVVDRFSKIGAIALERSEADEALNRARSDLAHVARVATLNAMTASLAHEVSQPLSGILTNANTCVRMLAAEAPDVARAIETARRTIRDANRASEVINRLRAMFSNKAAVAEAVDLNEAAREVIALSAAELRGGGVRLTTDFADDLPHLHGDRVQLQQVVLNLVLNGAEAMVAIDDRPKALHVRTSRRPEGGAELSVQDRGVGIQPDTVERLFKPFYTTKPNGMGVGLAISRSIVESHSGRLWATANEGPGATFAFFIPSSAAAAAELDPA